MKMRRLFAFAAVAAVFSFSSCQQDDESVANNEVSESTLTQISQLGFNTDNVQRVEGGYLVEGDIILSDSDLNDAQNVQKLRVGEAEQYRTTNLVSVGTTRTIKVAVSTTLPTAYVAAVDEAIVRYNDENLKLKFQRVSSGYDILLTKSPTNATYLASAGFPSGGNPHNRVLINSTYLGSNPGTNYLATILAHEIGHCIGFRHTDYMDRSYSCGGSYYNEGASTVGAIQVPGTPATIDPNSWMLACIGTGQNREFNANDKTALNYLY